SELLNVAKTSTDKGVLEVFLKRMEEPYFKFYYQDRTRLVIALMNNPFFIKEENLILRLIPHILIEMYSHYSINEGDLPEYVRDKIRDYLIKKIDQAQPLNEEELMAFADFIDKSLAQRVLSGYVKDPYSEKRKIAIKGIISLQRTSGVESSEATQSLKDQLLAEKEMPLLWEMLTGLASLGLLDNTLMEQFLRRWGYQYLLNIIDSNTLFKRDYQKALDILRALSPLQLRCFNRTLVFTLIQSIKNEKSGSLVLNRPKWKDIMLLMKDKALINSEEWDYMERIIELEPSRDMLDLFIPENFYREPAIPFPDEPPAVRDITLSVGSGVEIKTTAITGILGGVKYSWSEKGLYIVEDSLISKPRRTKDKTFLIQIKNLVESEIQRLAQQGSPSKAQWLRNTYLRLSQNAKRIILGNEFEVGEKVKICLKDETTVYAKIVDVTEFELVIAGLDSDLSDKQEIEKIDFTNIKSIANLDAFLTERSRLSQIKKSLEDLFRRYVKLDLKRIFIFIGYAVITSAIAFGISSLIYAVAPFIIETYKLSPFLIYTALPVFATVIVYLITALSLYHSGYFRKPEKTKELEIGYPASGRLFNQAVSLMRDVSFKGGSEIFQFFNRLYTLGNIRLVKGLPANALTIKVENKKFVICFDADVFKHYSQIVKLWNKNDRKIRKRLSNIGSEKELTGIIATMIALDNIHEAVEVYLESSIGRWQRGYRDIELKDTEAAALFFEAMAFNRLFYKLVEQDLAVAKTDEDRKKVVQAWEARFIQVAEEMDKMALSLSHRGSEHQSNALVMKFLLKFVSADETFTDETIYKMLLGTKHREQFGRITILGELARFIEGFPSLKGEFHSKRVKKYVDELFRPRDVAQKIKGLKKAKLRLHLETLHTSLRGLRYGGYEFQEGETTDYLLRELKYQEALYECLNFDFWSERFQKGWLYPIKSLAYKIWYTIKIGELSDAKSKTRHRIYSLRTKLTQSNVILEKRIREPAWVNKIEELLTIQPPNITQATGKVTWSGFRVLMGLILLILLAFANIRTVQNLTRRLDVQKEHAATYIAQPTGVGADLAGFNGNEGWYYVLNATTENLSTTHEKKTRTEPKVTIDEDGNIEIEYEDVFDGFCAYPSQPLKTTSDLLRFAEALDKLSQELAERLAEAKMVEIRDTSGKAIPADEFVRALKAKAVEVRNLAEAVSEGRMEIIIDDTNKNKYVDARKSLFGGYEVKERLIIRGDRINPEGISIQNREPFEIVYNPAPLFRGDIYPYDDVMPFEEEDRRIRALRDWVSGTWQILNENVPLEIRQALERSRQNLNIAWALLLGSVISSIIGIYAVFSTQVMNLLGDVREFLDDLALLKRALKTGISRLRNSHGKIKLQGVKTSAALSWINLGVALLVGVIWLMLPGNLNLPNLVIAGFIYFISFLIHEYAHKRDSGLSWAKFGIIPGGLLKGGIGFPDAKGLAGIKASFILTIIFIITFLVLYRFLPQYSPYLIPAILINLIFASSVMDWRDVLSKIFLNKSAQLNSNKRLIGSLVILIAGLTAMLGLVYLFDVSGVMGFDFRVLTEGMELALSGNNPYINPAYVTPPTMIFVMCWARFFDLTTAFWLWTFINIACLAISLYMIAHRLLPHLDKAGWLSIFGILLFNFFPNISMVIVGQVGGIITLLMTLAIFTTDELISGKSRRPTLSLLIGSGALALAICMKIYPVVMLGILFMVWLLHHKTQAGKVAFNMVIWTGLSSILIFGLTILLLGDWGYFPQWIEHMRINFFNYQNNNLAPATLLSVFRGLEIWFNDIGYSKGLIMITRILLPIGWVTAMGAIVQRIRLFTAKRWLWAMSFAISLAPTLFPHWESHYNTIMILPIIQAFKDIREVKHTTYRYLLYGLLCLAFLLFISGRPPKELYEFLPWLEPLVGSPTHPRLLLLVTGYSGSLLLALTMWLTKSWTDKAVNGSPNATATPVSPTSTMQNKTALFFSKLWHQ
ncbi:MAG: DUF2029 domain-containing protein, partial [Candidatus Omnitrophica bacterium]|nr:DUF2029 domain-containing protein [Candidatus Omnitrophota bacterium]